MSCPKCGSIKVIIDYITEKRDHYICANCGNKYSEKKQEITMERNNQILKSERIKIVMSAGDFFKCSNPNCGYTVRMRVLGNSARCSQCGATMYRIP